jgi:hypothetical protein
MVKENENGERRHRRQQWHHRNNGNGESIGVINNNGNDVALSIMAAKWR